jgi:hypothetical protein
MNAVKNPPTDIRSDVDAILSVLGAAQSPKPAEPTPTPGEQKRGWLARLFRR